MFVSTMFFKFCPSNLIPILSTKRVTEYSSLKKISFAIIIFFFSLIVSFYHFGIEQDFFEESTVCGLKSASEIISKDEILKQLQEKTISCKDVTFKIFGLSLTTFNMLISFLLTIFLTKMSLEYGKN